jgi:uncharacterized protein YjiS (DUF1127 family)
MATAMSHPTHHHGLTGIRPPGSLRALGRMLRLWRTRMVERQRLSQFDARSLHDLGAPSWDVERELAKHFWQD